MMGRGGRRRGGKGQPPGEPARALRHIPVLLSEVVDHLALKPGGVVIDGTFGAGGYSRAILDAADCRVLAIDRDAAAVKAGQQSIADSGGRLTLVDGRFSGLDEIARAHRHAAVDGVVLDVGVSSMQLDEAARGFSFMQDGPLDMRMTGDGREPSAADVVNGASEAELADIFFHLGEERRARPVARAIVSARRQQPIRTTGELAKLIESVLGRPRGSDRHPATQVFQALRIYVNDELAELAQGLAAAERILGPGGRLVVVTFHSLEDRIVKRFLAERGKPAPKVSRHLPGEIAADRRSPSFRIVNPRPLSPNEDEVRANPRARSARLRCGERTDAPAWPLDPVSLGVPQLRQLPRAGEGRGRAKGRGRRR